MKFYIFTITITLFALLSISMIYGEKNININNNNNSIQQNSNITTVTNNKILEYKFEPFLLLDEKDFEDISHNDTLSLENFAIAAWIKTNQTNLIEPAHLVNKGGFNTDEKGENMNYGIWFSVDGTISGGFETKSGEDFEVKSTAKYNDGKWHYVLLSYDGSLLRLDIDGKKQISTQPTNGAIPDTTGDQPLRMGANSLDESKFFTGNIDEVRVWDRGLTDKEISQIYAKNTFDSNGLVVYLNFGGDEVSLSSSSAINNTTKSIENLTSTTTNNGSVTNKINETTSSSSSTSSPLLTPNGKTNATATLPSHPQDNKTITTEEKFSPFNIAVASDWGCKDFAKKTAENIQSKKPELVIAVGDLSYGKSADCWFKIIEPFKSKMKIAIGDHEYSDTTSGAVGVINQYLKPLNLEKTYYSFDMNNAHFVFIDPYIDYKPGSPQYQFIENDLKTASTNPKIDWRFVAESPPIYTSPSQHPGNSTIRDIYHPLFDKYDVDLVFTSNNHNYQRTFPLKYNSKGGDSSDPIIANRDQNNYNYNSNNDKSNGVIYLITGTAGRSLYPITQQAPFVAKQNDQHFGFLNIDISGNTLKGTFYANKSELPRYHYVKYQNDMIIDHFTISKTNKPNDNKIGNV
ncbi:MAG TPA: LamG-like jellyroll fold domain-containing protein [Nitrososphaeraceae archaeon]|nr:LamG-like jellyroll fold domain-containing protein [Nitrososphaeraceae archaeon]